MESRRLSNSMDIITAATDTEHSNCNVQLRRCRSEPPRHLHAEVLPAMRCLGIELDIDAAEHQRRGKLREDGQHIESTHERARATSQVLPAMRCFGVELDIDAVEHQRRSKLRQDGQQKESTHERAQATSQVLPAMRCFGVELDIDAVEHQRRGRLGEEGQHMESTHERAQVAMRAGDIEKVVKRKHFPASPRRGKSPDESSLSTERRQFFEQTFAASRWAKLMDRPLRGNRSDVWQSEAQPDVRVDNDLPDYLKVVLCELERDMQYELAKQQGKPAPPETAFVQKLQKSLQNVVKKSMSADSSGASTASGDTPVCDIDTCTPSPEAFSNPSTPRETVSPALSDANFHIINDPKGTHALLQSRDSAAMSCKSLHFPLGLRRVMCAALPADPEASLPLSRGQVRQLSDLCTVMEQHKQTANHCRTSQKLKKSQHPAKSGATAISNRQAKAPWI